MYLILVVSFSFNCTSLSLGCHTLLAGDDEGTIWCYNLKEIISKCDSEEPMDDLPLSVKTEVSCQKLNPFTVCGTESFTVLSLLLQTLGNGMYSLKTQFSVKLLEKWKF